MNKNSNQQIWLYFGIIFIIAVVFYSRTIGFGLIDFDDQIRVQNHAYIHSDPSNAIKAFTDSFGVYYRPVMTLSYIMDAQSGGTDPTVYHRTNVLLHALSSALVFLALFRLGYKRNLSFFFGLVFAVHPLLASVASWIPARDISIVVISLLLSLIFLIKYIDTKGNSNRWLYAALHVFFYIMSLFTKPVAIGFPVICMFYIYYIRKEKLPAPGYISIATAWLVLTAIWYFVRKQAVANVTILPEVKISALWGNIPAIFDIAGKSIFPWDLFLHANYNMIEITAGVLLIAAIILGMFKLSNINKPIIIMGLGFFLLMILPTLLIKTGNSDIFYDYGEWRGYIPIFGLILIGCEILRSRQIDFTKNKHVFAGGAIVIILAVKAFSYQPVFENGMSFWSDYLDKYPNKSFAYEGLSKQYYFDGDKAKARELMLKGLEINPENRNILEAASILFQQLGDYKPAEKYALKLIEIDGTIPKPYFQLGIIYEAQKKYDEALKSYRKAIKIKPDYAVAWSNMGNIYYFSNDMLNAEKFWKESLKYNPGLVTSLQNLVILYYSANRLYEARDYYNLIKQQNGTLSPKLEKKLLRAFQNLK